MEDLARAGNPVAVFSKMKRQRGHVRVIRIPPMSVAVEAGLGELVRVGYIGQVFVFLDEFLQLRQ